MTLSTKDFEFKNECEITSIKLRDLTFNLKNATSEDERKRIVERLKNLSSEFDYYIRKHLYSKETLTVDVICPKCLNKVIRVELGTYITCNNCDSEMMPASILNET